MHGPVGPCWLVRLVSASRGITSGVRRSGKYIPLTWIQQIARHAEAILSSGLSRCFSTPYRQKKRTATKPTKAARTRKTTKVTVAA